MKLSSISDAQRGRKRTRGQARLRLLQNSLLQPRAGRLLHTLLPRRFALWQPARGRAACKQNAENAPTPRYARRTTSTYSLMPLCASSLRLPSTVSCHCVLSAFCNARAFFSSHLYSTYLPPTFCLRATHACMLAPPPGVYQCECRAWRTGGERAGCGGPYAAFLAYTTRHKFSLIAAAQRHS